MWKIVWFENGEEKDMVVGTEHSFIDLETELLQLEDMGVNTNKVKVYSPEGTKMNYLEAMQHVHEELDKRPQN